MRRKLIEADAIECVLGLGPNLFYIAPVAANDGSSGTAAGAGKPELTEVLESWLKNSAQVRSSLRELLAKGSK